MKSVVLAHEVDWEGWRNAARDLTLQDVLPEEVVWSVAHPDDLFAQNAQEIEPTAAPGAFRVPRALVELAETAIQAREPARFALLYRLLRRAHTGDLYLPADAEPAADRDC